MEIFFRDDLLNQTFIILAPLLQRLGHIICDERSNHTPKNSGAGAQAAARVQPRSQGANLSDDQIQRKHASEIAALVVNANAISKSKKEP